MKLYLLLLFECFVFSLFGQYTIEGNVSNHLNEPLIGATIVLLESADSTMVAFSLTNTEGGFEIGDLEQGDYILQVSYIGHQIYSQRIDFDWAQKVFHYPNIIMIESTEVLQEITIAAEHIPMGIRGDTISYNAAAFKTRPNATVEDLLKKLPGIEVERNGNIKAQGEDVENVLVDGKEFFGSDPQMATKNLEAESVDKVEVFDKQSAMAEFTGIDDGMEEKTINLKLKEDFKKGGFGNVEVAAGTDDRYNGKINYFRFSPTSQASIIGARNNLNMETFSINDRIDFLGGIGNVMSSGGISISNYRGKSDGLNTSTSLGANFNYDISSKLKFISHFLQRRLENDLDQTTTSFGFVDRFDYSSQDTLFSNGNDLVNQINTKLTYKLSPFFNLILTNNVDWDEANNDHFETSYLTRTNVDQGFSLTDLSSNNKNVNFLSRALLKSKFDTDGRNLVTYLSYQRTKDDDSDFINNMNEVVNNMIDLNQQQIYESVKNEFDASLRYTEPIGTKMFLGLSYNINANQEDPFRDFYNLINEDYILDEINSKGYIKNYLHHLTGISLRRNRKKLKWQLGLSGQVLNLDGEIDGVENAISGTYKYLLPYANIDYRLKGGKEISLNYNANVVAPTIHQLLPLSNNAYSNFYFIGNPELVPEYRNELRLRFSLYDNFNFTNLWIHLNLSTSKNRIVNKTFIDENLFQIVEPVNANRHNSMRAYLNFSKPFKALKINYRIRGSINLSDYDSFINDQESQVKDNNYNFRLSINNRNTDLFNIESGIDLNYNTRAYGINPDFNQNYFNTDYFLDFDFYISDTWTLSSEFTYRKYSNESFADSQDYKLWSASISKSILDNKLEFKASVFDILKENIGYRRYGDTNAIYESFYNNLQQYFMLGITYKIGNGKKDKGVIMDFDN
ncbi:MAG: outer membrane beta-barrel protein [Saprospiraceae bacterium]|nr:outer membrane beta-barrel protein [Saprospiraceae bacterium]